MDAIHEIQSIRNDLCHNANTSIPDIKFDGLWQKLETATVNLAQPISQVPPYVTEIHELINDAKVNNMPDLGDALREFYESYIRDLNSKVINVEENMRKVKMTTEDNLNCSKENQAILKDSTVQKAGPSGRPVKRMRIDNNIFNHLNKRFKATLTEALLTDLEFTSEVEDIKTKLLSKHHIVVTGQRGSRFLEASLAAIKDLPYDHERCVEINELSDWKLIGFEEVDLVLCKHPFSDFRKVDKKAEEMNRVLSTMCREVKPSDGETNIDILVVSDEDVLMKFKSAFNNEILADVVSVCSSTSEKAPIDLTNDMTKGSEGEISSCLKNLIDVSEIIAESNKDKCTVSSAIVKAAEEKLKKHKVILITGQRYGGQKSLALKLALKYKKGEYLILNKADDFIHVSMDRVCLLVVEDFAGKWHYDSDRARNWMRAFESWCTVVKAGKINMILTCEDKMLEKCKEEFENHQFFDNTVQIKHTDMIIKQEKDENVSPNKSMTSGVNTNIQNSTQKKRKLENIRRPLDEKKMKTLVFMHINTTSLPKSSDCRITELCLLAVNRNSFNQLRPQMQTSLPRVRNKLSMCFDPDKPILSEAVNISKLSNELLSDLQQFTLQSISTIESFFSNLQQPLCLVAHNCNNFDFKVLKAELKRLKSTSMSGEFSSDDSDDEMEIINNSNMSVADKEFDHILCVDSLIFCREVLSSPLKSCALRPLFQEMFGRSAPNTHTTEGFCNALLSVVQTLPNFLSWVEQNAKPMSSIEPAY